MKTDHYLFRRQFIISPYRIDRFEHWNRAQLPDGTFLTVHPDLSFNIVKNNDEFIVLLGYLLDPFNPYRKDKQIISDMLSACTGCSDLIKYLEPMGGRYVIVAKLKNTRIILNDPAGFRQLFYTIDPRNGYWAVSQPSLLAEILNLHIDKQIESDLFGISLFAKGYEYWYPGILTAFNGVYRLVPNHYLDLSDFRQVRYWPSASIKEVKVEDCVEQSAEILRGLYWSIENRYQLAQAVTAGLDSRIVLAASRHLKGKIHYFTHTHRKLGYNGIDIVIPSKMLSELGIDHHVLIHSENMDPSFEKVYRRNVTTARFEHGINAFTLHRHFAELGREMVVINGVCGEITRNFYYLPKMVTVNGYSLCGLTGMKGSRLAFEQFENWLEQSRAVANSCGIPVLDLFYWEQRVGSWAAMSYSEYDIAFESFSPLNCRILIQRMLGVKSQYRCAPDNYLQTELIRRMWPETLNFSINPPQSAVGRLILGMKRTPLHGLLKTLKFIRYSGLLSN